MRIINYHILPFQSTDIEDAIHLLEKYYQYENQEIEFMPPFEDYKKNIKRVLQILVDKKQGFVMRENEVMLGYIAGFPIPEFFGKENGIFVPVYGHATMYSKRDEIEQILYSYAAQKWVNFSLLTHVIAIFAHDNLVKELYFQNGFGNRCVDAIRKLEPRKEKIHINEIIEITLDNLTLVESIHSEHSKYYRSSPIFMPTQDEDALEDLKSWFNHEEKRMFCYKLGDKVVGYIRYQLSGESIFSNHLKMRSVTGLYVLPEYRKQGIAKSLLDFVESNLLDNQMELVGVDYESINPKANRFWNTHFIPYTYSLVRRIDERIKCDQ